MKRGQEEASSFLSPPVRQLVVAPTCHLLEGHGSSDNSTTTTTKVADVWVEEDGSFNWAMLTTYCPSAEETEVESSTSLSQKM